MLIAAIISFVSMMLMVSHFSPRWLRRVVGYKAATDIVLHGTILYMFFGTSTEGLLQAEAAGIMFSLWLRSYRLLAGYERLEMNTSHRWRWVRYSGLLNRGEAK